jgi:hypothetical protein
VAAKGTSQPAAFLLFAALLGVTRADASLPKAADVAGLSLPAPQLPAVAPFEPSRFGFAEGLALLAPESTPGRFGLFGLETSRFERTYARNNPIRYYDPNGKEVADGVQLRKDRDYALATGGPSGLASFDRASMQGLKYGLMAFGAMAAYGAVAEYGPALLAAGQQFLSRFGDRVERAISEANPVLEKVGSDLATKGEAREVLSKMGLPNAQADAVRSAISRATSSDTIDILRSKAGDVVVNLTRPGADGRQVMEYTIGQDGAKIPIQKAYDVFGNLVHLDPK